MLDTNRQKTTFWNTFFFFFFFYKGNRIWHFMQIRRQFARNVPQNIIWHFLQIVSSAWNIKSYFLRILHEKWNPIFWEKIRNKRPIGHDAHQRSSVDNDDINKDRQWTTSRYFHCFAFLSYNSLRNLNWPCNIGQSKWRVIVWINKTDRKSSMLHTKFQGHRPFGFLDE